MKKLRKVSPAKRKKRAADAKAKLQKQTALMMKHPTECCVCAHLFERTEKTIKEWQVTVNEDRVRLTCPSCWQKINEALEKINAI